MLFTAVTDVGQSKTLTAIRTPVGRPTTELQGELGHFKLKDLIPFVPLVLCYSSALYFPILIRHDLETILVLDPLLHTC